MPASCTVVIMTRNRVADLLRSLALLEPALDGSPVIVVDNGSTDGTPDRVRSSHPWVRVVELGENRGVVARNLGVELADTPVVAFSDDDSWWGPGSLTRAVELLERHDRVGAVVAHVIVGPEGRDDPVSLLMRDGPLRRDADGPGVPVLGFLACAVVVRREAFREVGGFEPRFQFAGEEALLAADLATAGWDLRYVPDVVVHHHPAGGRQPAWRRRRELRNHLWFLWLRRPVAAALRGSARAIRSAGPSVAAPAVVEALSGLGWIARARRPVPPALESVLRRLEAEPPPPGDEPPDRQPPEPAV
jgi:N-acetylglucosaminyl-diphospho-decaprenol L-rhamnosyltransferase